MALLGGSGPLHYCTSICRRFWCTSCASCLDLINQTKKARTKFRTKFQTSKSPSHTGKTRKCVPKKNLKHHCRDGSQWIALDGVHWRCAILFEMLLELFLFEAESRHFARENTVSEWSFAVSPPNFSSPLPVLESPCNFRVTSTSPNSRLEMWQGFCHPKIIQVSS